MVATKQVVLAALCMMLALAAVAEAGVYQDIVLADGPVGYWSFQDGDTSGPAVNSAVSGSVLDGAYPKFAS